MASLPSIRITSEILLTATLTDKDNPSSDAFLLAKSQETFVEGQRAHF